MTVDRQDARQSETQPVKPQASQSDAFVKHLEHASAVVQSWPAWKQQLLGGTAVTQASGHSGAVAAGH